jgi:hypothetical protein
MNEAATSREERFFGVRNEIDLTEPPAKTKAEEAVPEIVVEDEPKPQAEPAKDKPPAKVEGEDFEPDFGDDFDPELKKHLSEKVQKRISTLTWEREQAKREREEARRIQQEVENFARQTWQSNQGLQQTIRHGEAYLVEKMTAAAEASAKNAEAQYRKAYEEGDTDAIIAAQREIIRAQGEQEYAAAYKADYEARKQQQAHSFAQQPPRQAPQNFTPNVPKPSDKTLAWVKQNPWFDDPAHRKMTRYAYLVHEELVADEGLNPESDRYFERLNEEVQRRFPNYFDAESGDGTPTVSAPQRSPNPVVAPAGRTNPGSRKTIKLTQRQVDLAKRLGLTAEQYAAEVAKGGQ